MATSRGETVTRTLRAAADGDVQAAADLLPLVYAELRKLARARMPRSLPETMLPPTALVHEAYLRLVGKGDPGWHGRGHFFGAAAQAMRQILVERARQGSTKKRGGDRQRIDLSWVEPPEGSRSVDVLALDEALTQLEQADPRQAKIVTLRYFVDEAAAALAISPRTVKREWRLAKRFLYALLS